ncbi:MAG: LruC domain-containing protein [Bacteroidaceae bacterium]|nr:LruC domain-containing protein [Bacteroidaceae bacterium]
MKNDHNNRWGVSPLFLKNWTLLLLLVLSFSACKHDSIVTNGELKKPASDYFDFSTRLGTTLKIDYGYEGYTAPFAIYLENPYDESTGLLKENSLSIFTGFTDKHCKYDGLITLPIGTKKVFLCSDAIGIPSSIELEVLNGSVVYTNDASAPQLARAKTRAEESINIGSHKSVINESSKLYALYDTFKSSGGDYNWETLNTNVPALYSLVSNSEQLTISSTLGELVNRVQSALRGNYGKKQNNTSYIATESNINPSVLEKTADGKDVVGAELDLVLLDANGGMHNAMGYYYYKTSETLSASQLKALPKYMVFPRTTKGSPSNIISARLQFFGENYDQEGTDVFPPGYSIGWMLVADINGFLDRNSLSSSANATEINDRINTYYTSGHAIYSNQSANTAGRAGCISIYDRKSQRIIVGFEDFTFPDNNSRSDNSYEDILFYVNASPIEAISVEVPVVPDAKTKVAEENSRGTLAFEDIWPSGGDYDLNDVVVEYETIITHNDLDEIEKIESVYKVVHDGAKATDAFGCLINGTVGNIDADASNYNVREENNQFIFTPSAIEAAASGEIFKLTRTFAEGSRPIKSSYTLNINPFIVPNYVAGEKNRTEVHLPKSTVSPWANSRLLGTKDDAYYINKGGDYPFAIDLYNVTNFEVVSETRQIGSENEYPYFTNWVESKGATNTDWYQYKSR